MSRRAGIACAIGAAMVLGASAALAISLGSGSPASSREASVSGSGPYRGSEPPAGIAMPDFSLRNFDRRLVRSSDLRGRVSLITFLDSQCTDSCPVIAWTAARTIDTLTPGERENVRAVAISTDPAEDTRASVHRFLARNRALGRLRYLGGEEPEPDLRGIWAAFFVLSSLESGKDTLHSAPVRIYDRNGTWVTTLHPGADLTEANLAHDIRAALASEGDE